MFVVPCARVLRLPDFKPAIWSWLPARVALIR
jgi:hypothetical protein